VRVFSLSNNHTYDKGASGIAATLRFWGSMPEDVVTTGLWKGKEDYGHIPLQTVNGVTIAYLSYTEHTNGIPQNSSMQANVIYTSQTDVIEQQVKAARQLADFVVVGVHWGVENLIDPVHIMLCIKRRNMFVTVIETVSFLPGSAAMRLLINGSMDQIISCCRKADSLNQRLRFRLWRRLCFFRL